MYGGKGVVTSPALCSLLQAGKDVTPRLAFCAWHAMSRLFFRIRVANAMKDLPFFQCEVFCFLWQAHGSRCVVRIGIPSDALFIVGMCYYEEGWKLEANDSQAWDT